MCQTADTTNTNDATGVANSTTLILPNTVFAAGPALTIVPTVTPAQQY